MVKLQDFVEVLEFKCRNYPAVFIVNKPYNAEHILFNNLDCYPSTLKKILAAMGDAPVVTVQLNAVISDTRGSYSGTKIYIQEPDAFFNLGDPETYGDGYIDFGDIEDNTYDRQQFYTYKDMGFHIPGHGLRIPE